MMILVPSSSRAQQQHQQQQQPQPPAVPEAAAKRRRSIRVNGIDRLSALSTDVLVHICEYLVGRHPVECAQR
jgi:hypothetical protein